MARIQGYTEDDLDVLIAEFEGVVERSLRSVARGVADNLRPAIVAASSAGLGPADVMIAEQLWQEEVDGVITPYVAQVYTGSAVQVAMGIGDAFPDGELPGVPLLADEFAVTYMKTVQNRLSGVGDEIWEDIRNELLDGIHEGLSVEQIADRIANLANFEETRARRIARTEVHAASESGSMAQMEFMGYDKGTVTKEWVSTRDGRTRETHRFANGQRVELGELFLVGLSHLQFPGDPTGAPSEIINCRCTTVFDVDEAPEFRCNAALTAATEASGQCVIPTPQADIASIAESLREALFAAFMAHKISPAFGGAKIHKVLADVRDTVGEGQLAGIDNFQVLSVVDHKYTGSAKGTFLGKYTEWLQTPAGQKATGGLKIPSPVTHVITHTDHQADTPTIPEPAPPVTPPIASYEPQILSPPSQPKFTILDDPGASGDGSMAPGAPWGKYGSSGLLIRAVGEDGVARFLLIQRGGKYIGSQQYKWQLPGGGLDAKETAYDAAARELWEETGATPEYVDAMLPVGEYVFSHPKFPAWKYTSIGAHAEHTFVPDVSGSGSTGDAQWFTLDQLQAMMDNGDIVKELQPTLMQIAQDLDHMAPAVAKPVKLPTVASVPEPGQIQFTGKTLGSHGAQVWENPATGERWLFKPQERFLTEIDVGTAKIQSKATSTRPGVYRIKLNGQWGSIQYMFDSSKAAFPGGSFDPLTLSAPDLLVMQREQIFDWMISNFDTHSGQWIRLADGTLFETDKGQAFKFFGKDKLTWDYVPVTPLGSDKLTYSKIWKAFVNGDGIAVQDPTTGALGEYVDRLMAISDSDYRAMLRPYATARAKQFGLSKTWITDFLDTAVARKNHLRQDFEEFWQKAVAAREAKTGVKFASTPDPKPPAPAPPTPATTPPPTFAGPPAPAIPVAAPTVATMVDDIAGVSLATKQAILAKWVELGNGKKVTPAWGGSKIWKLLQDLKAAPFTDASLGDMMSLNHLQLLRILDEVGGFAGKPKTYESVLVDWLESAAGKKAVSTIPSSLTKKAAKAVVSAPVKAAAKKPATIAGKFEGDEVTSGEFTDWFYNVTTPNEVGATWYDELLGAQFRVILKADDNEIHIEEFDAITGEWVTQEVVKNVPQVIKYDLKAVAANTADPVVPVVPLQTGLAPGTSVTIDQIKLTLEFDPLQPNEVIAVTKSANGLYDYRVIHKPATPSGYVIQMKHTQGKNWMNTASELDDIWAQALEWKTPSIGMNAPPVSTIPSKVYGKGPGDVVSPAELGLSKHLFNPGDVMAEATDPFTGAKWRVSLGTSGRYKFEIKTSTGDWLPTGAMKIPVEHYEWHLTGDVLLNQTKSKLPGKNVGDKLTTDEIWSLAWGNVPMGDMVAYRWDDFTGTMYRLKIQTAADGGDMEIEWLNPQGQWQHALLVTGPEDLGDVDWYAAHPLKPNEIPDPLKAFVEPPTLPPPPSPPVQTMAQKKAAKKAAVAAKKAAKVTPPPVSKTPLTGVSTHIPGKVVGENITPAEITAHASKYVEGEIVATGGGTWSPLRLIWTEDGIVQQKQLASGAWKSDKMIDADWKLYGQWKAANGSATKPQITAAKKFAAKKTTPPVKKAPGSSPITHSTKSSSGYANQPGLSPGELRNVDLSPWDDAEQKEIFEFIRLTSGVKSYWSPEQLWGAIQQVKSHFAAKYKGKYLGLNEIEILRMLDAGYATQKGATDLHIFEAKIVNWLKTPQGKFFVNRRIDAPIMATDVPVPMSAYADFPAPDTQTYKVVSTSEALTYRAESHAKYGGWKTGEKEATKVYTGGSYSSWNEAIRRGELKSYKSNIIKTQNGMRPSTRPMLLHRGTSFAELNDPSITSYETLLPYVGRTYVNRGFNSTSVGGSSAFSGQLLIEYEVPAGTPMSYVADFSQHPSERETLLPTHMTYQILSVTKKPGGGNTTIMRVRVLGPATS